MLQIVLAPPAQQSVPVVQYSSYGLVCIIFCCRQAWWRKFKFTCLRSYCHHGRGVDFWSPGLSSRHLSNLRPSLAQQAYRYVHHVLKGLDILLEAAIAMRVGMVTFGIGSLLQTLHQPQPIVSAANAQVWVRCGLKGVRHFWRLLL